MISNHTMQGIGASGLGHLQNLPLGALAPTADGRRQTVEKDFLDGYPVSLQVKLGVPDGWPNQGPGEASLRPHR